MPKSIFCCVGCTIKKEVQGLESRMTRRGCATFKKEDTVFACREQSKFNVFCIELKLAKLFSIGAKLALHVVTGNKSSSPKGNSLVAFFVHLTLS
jgi:hypothetical protein